LGSQHAAFLQKYLFGSARVFVQRFLTGVPTIKEILQRELGLKKSSQHCVPIFVPRQKVVRVEASTEMLRILQESEENHFEGMATGDEFWFQYSYPSSKMLTSAPTDVIPMEVAAHRDEEKYDNNFLRWAQTNRARRLTKRRQIQPAVFRRLEFFHI
jgi:hypothetical protein